MIKNLAVGGGSNKLLLISALVLGLLAAVLVGVYLSSLDSDGGSGTTSSATVPVVVATQDIPAATTITAEMVAVKAIPGDLALIGAFSETTAAVGQTTQVAIINGEQIVPSKVASASTASEQYGPNPPLSVKVPDGKRGFAIKISSVSAAGGLIRPGDHVDVLLSAAGLVDDSGVEQAANACYVVQNIQVLAVGSTITETTSDTDANGIAAAETDEGAGTMTLSASPIDATILAAAQQSVSGDGVDNQLWVSLRKFSDHAIAGDVPTCTLVAPAQ
jgi:pilus assembly protein CpaB